MAWVTLQNSPEVVDEAGETLISRGSDDEYSHALGVINNFRAAHSFPLNTFQVYLRERASTIHPGSLVTQRLKRLKSIDAKLRSFKTLKRLRDTPLSQMQDIGGCRAVMPSVATVRQLTAAYTASSIKHKLIDDDDYIANPKRSGYRGVHLIYSYYSDKKTHYNGLKLEIQLRSRLQHAWATAVETVGTFTGQQLKSGRGREDWLRFFALMGSAIAARERTPLVPNTPTRKNERVEELSRLATSLNVERQLEGFTAVLTERREIGLFRGGGYYLLELDPQVGLLTIRGFRGRVKASADAARAYAQAER